MTNEGARRATSDETVTRVAEPDADYSNWTEEGFAVKPNSIRYGENWSGGRARNSSPEMNSEGMGISVDAYG